VLVANLFQVLVLEGARVYLWVVIWVGVIVRELALVGRIEVVVVELVVPYVPLEQVVLSVIGVTVD
jgi:hypothetical protein